MYLYHEIEPMSDCLAEENCLDLSQTPRVWHLRVCNLPIDIVVLVMVGYFMVSLYGFGVYQGFIQCCRQCMFHRHCRVVHLRIIWFHFGFSHAIHDN